MNNDKKILFIGAGVMAEGIIRGLTKNNTVKAKNIGILDINKQRIDYMKKVYGVLSFDNIKICAKDFEYIIIAVKPKNIEEVLEELNNLISNNVIISIVAGKSIEEMTNIIGVNKKVVRVIPTPFIEGENGLNILFTNDNLIKSELDFVERIFKSIGEIVYLPEKQFNNYTGFGSAACGAFILEYIESMVDAGVRTGFSRKQSEEFVLSSIMSVVKTIMKTGEHPAIIKNKMSSPAGVTIEGLYELNNGNFRAILQSAVEKSVEKANNLI